MTLTLNLTEADNRRIEEFAARENCSVKELALRALTEMLDREVAKERRNAEYLAKIDRGLKQMAEGTGRHFTDEELEALFHGNEL